MKFALSRRGFLVGFGGGAASASLVWGTWRRYPWTSGLKEAYPVTPCCTYVDFNGWLLTRADKDRLTSPEGGTSR